MFILPEAPPSAPHKYSHKPEQRNEGVLVWSSFSGPPSQDYEVSTWWRWAHWLAGFLPAAQKASRINMYVHVRVWVGVWVGGGVCVGGEDRPV